MGLGNNMRLTLFSRLKYFDQPSALTQYNKAKFRLIFISADGVILPSNGSSQFLQSEGVISSSLATALKLLCNNKKTMICFVSDKDKSYLDAHLSDINDLVIAAENGYYYKYCESLHTGDWNKISNNQLYRIN